MTDTEMSDLERRCVERYERDAPMTVVQIIRAVLAEAGVTELVEALTDAEQALISAKAFILSKHGATNPSREAAIERAAAALAKIGATQ